MVKVVMNGISKRVSIILLFAGLLFLPYCTSSKIEGTGQLKGIVSIGPICPVETDPPLPGCLPTAETYKAYKAGIWTTNGKKLIATINPDLDGDYEIELISGTYLVKLVNQQTIGGSNLPVLVTINDSGCTVLDINIDTGIR
jgi:hypothetical protein